MNTYAFVALLVLGGIDMYLPHLLLWRRKHVRGKALEAVSAKFAEVDLNFKLLVWICLPLVGAAFLMLGSGLLPLVGTRTYYLAGAFFASYAAMAGLFALLTGVCPVPSRMPVFYYVYEDGPYLRKVARLQLGIALVVAVVSVFLTLVPVSQ